MLALDDVRFVRDDRAILDGISWSVYADERWVVLGANGSGKTTLVRIAAFFEHPSAGEVTLLGERLGRTDVRVLRRRVGYASAKLAADLRPQLTAIDAVMTAKNAALEPWWHRYDDADRARARCASTAWAWPASHSDPSARCRRASSSASCSPAR